MANAPIPTSEAARQVRISRLAALFTLVGFLTLGALIARNVRGLNDLEAQIETRQSTVIQLRDRVQNLNSTVYTLRYSPDEVITPRAAREALPGIMDGGRQVYDFTVWIDLSSYRRREMRRVTYRTRDTASHFQERIAENAVNGFSISFRGTDCVEVFVLDIEFADGTSDSVDFAMCQALER